MQAILIALSLAVAGDPVVNKAAEPTTRVYVRTIPTGAEIKLDGQPRGKSDALFVVPPGVQIMTVEVELDGHYPQRQELEIRGGRITRVELLMQKRPSATAEPKPATPPAAPPTSPSRPSAKPATNAPLPPATPGSLPITPAEERVERALSEKATFRYDKTPFVKVLDEFKSASGGVEIVLDQKALEEVGFAVDKQVTFAAADVSRRSALEYIVRQEGLTWTVRGDVLIITTTDEDTNAYRLTKVYSIADLTPDREAVRKAILETIERTSWQDVGGPGSLNLLPSASTAPAARDAKNEAKRGPAKGEPSSAKTPVSGGGGGIGAGRLKGSLKLEPGAQPSLVIFQTYRIHRQIMDLLTTLREVSSKQPADRSATAAARLPIYTGRRGDQEILEKALGQPTALSYTERLFADIVTEIQKEHKVPILCDGKALEEVGFATDKPITFRMRGVPLRQALTLLLRPEGLVWTFHDDLVVITTPDEEANELLLAVYPIADIVKEDAPGSLIQTIQNTIDPTGWNPVGGPSAIAPLTVRGLPVLVVSQTRSAHEEIANLFEQLRVQRLANASGAGVHESTMTVPAGPSSGIQPQVKLALKVTGPSSATVGQDIDFYINVTNVGGKPLKDVKLECEFDSAFDPKGASVPPSALSIASGGNLIFQRGSLDPGQMTPVQVRCACVLAQEKAILRVRASAADAAAVEERKLLTIDKPGATPSIVLSHVRDSAEKRRSFADAGHAVRFDRPQGAKSVTAVQLFCSRYGYPQPPQENFHIYIVDQNQKMICDVPVPYAKIERGDMRWYTFEIPSTPVPERFFVAVAFNAHQTKGVYLGMDDNVKESHSYAGLPESGFKKLNEKADWMIRVLMSPK